MHLSGFPSRNGRVFPARLFAIPFFYFCRVALLLLVFLLARVFFPLTCALPKGISITLFFGVDSGTGTHRSKSGPGSQRSWLQESCRGPSVWSPTGVRGGAGVCSSHSPPCHEEAVSSCLPLGSRPAHTVATTVPAALISCLVTCSSNTICP